MSEPGGSGDQSRGGRRPRRGGNRRRGGQQQRGSAASHVDATASATSHSNHGDGSFSTSAPSKAARGGSSSQPSTMAPRRAFGGNLTSNSNSATSSGSLSGFAPEFVPGKPVVLRSVDLPVRQPNAAGPHSVKRPRSSAPDLPSRIHEDIDNGHYECVICTSEILRTSLIWSCSTCWTVIHIDCAKEWYSREMKDKSNSANNTDEQAAKNWRCPGCNSVTTRDPAPPTCWCGKEDYHKSSAGLPPNSCGQTCGRPRATCPHPCLTEICHAGPCPPCAIMEQQPCLCGKHTSTKRCSETDRKNGWRCGERCDELLPCLEHSCTRSCHSGVCGECTEPTSSTCYCGKSQKEMPCEERGDICESFFHGQWTSSRSEIPPLAKGTRFEGSYSCNTICGRVFDCGIHSCQRDCHPQDADAAPCPMSPSMVSHCPCGKTALEDLLKEPRRTCTDEVPRCEKKCSKLLPCGHGCNRNCQSHPELDSCPPCEEIVKVPCRCGRTTKDYICHRRTSEPPTCSRVCRAQLNCGRHTCGGVCCPGEKSAAQRQAAKQKKNADLTNHSFEDEHICVRTCGRPLVCHNHSCDQLCHRGPCPSCPESIFDEISCACGKTRLYPPQPCGTRPPDCRYECARPSPPCGHAQVAHNCHPDDISCPRCPFLVEKICVCGKQTVKNKPCGLDEVHCGLPCGKILKCGMHRCRQTCHRLGLCEDMGDMPRCSQICGKLRTSCTHTCRDQCHSPKACNEDKPCQAKTFITCDCKRRKQEVKCGASISKPVSSQEPLKCDDECLRLQRNARLAQAFNIDPNTHSDNHIPYSEDTLKLFKENITWASEQERALREFADDSTRKQLNFKPMPPPRRAFIHSLCQDYGLTSMSQDPDPHRHVSVFKTPQFYSAPMKTLSQCVKLMKGMAAAQGPPAPTLEPGSVGASFFNAIILSQPRFALTIEEVDATLAPDLAVRAGGPSLRFSTTFLTSEEFAISAVPVRTAASIAKGGSATPDAIEAALVGLKSAVLRTVKDTGIAEKVSLACVDGGLRITRREGDSADAGGWSAVVSRRPAKPAAVVVEQRGPKAVLSLKKTVPSRSVPPPASGGGEGRLAETNQEAGSAES